MNKAIALLYAALVPAIALGLGCVLTDYHLITDNDQVRAGGSGVVDTRGKAHVVESQWVAFWPDGSDDFIWFVDQKASGDRTLTTYNNFSTGSQPTYHGDVYCNPDWQGCAVTVADDPEVGDVDPFDYTANWNCDGARSISIMYDSYSRYGECGRDRLSLAERIALLNLGRLGTRRGVEGLFYDLTPRDVRVQLDNHGGIVADLPLTGAAVVFAPGSPTARVEIDLTDPRLAATGRAYADFLERHGTDRTTVTMAYRGVSFSQDIAGNRGFSTPARVLENLHRHY